MSETCRLLKFRSNLFDVPRFKVVSNDYIVQMNSYGSIRFSVRF